MFIKRIVVVAGAVVSLFALPAKATAWGGDGHRLIAEMAESRLSEPAKKEVRRLLAIEPGATLASVSTWADEVRSPATAAWHYVNFAPDANCRYTEARSCVEGACVVEAIERQRKVLASNAPDEQRLQALKYVVHLVGDVHQPLHGGMAEDRGGNSYQLQMHGRGTNLHAVWDSGILRDWPGGMSAVREAVEHATLSDAVSTKPAQWAEESCRVVASAGFYPPGRQLDDAYVERWSGVLASRMALAVQRLVTVLEQSLVKDRL